MTMINDPLMQLFLYNAEMERRSESSVQAAVQVSESREAE